MDNFASEVEKLKGTHRDAIRTLAGVALSDSQLQRFFRENGGITPDSLRKLLRQELERSSQSKNTEIVSVFLEKWIPDGKKMDIPQLYKEYVASYNPEDNPGEIAEGIARFIQSKMQYDAMSAIITVLPVFDIGKGDLSVLSNVNKRLLRTIGENQNIQINNNSRNEWIEKLRKNSKSITNPDTKKIIDTIATILEKKDGNEQRRIADTLMQIDALRLFEASFILRQTSLMIPDNIYTDKDTGLRNGVCRHYSLIAKMLYDEVKKNHPSNTQLQKSELLYVVNPQMQHAYNLLVYENPTGGIEKKYLDITDLIIRGSLYPQRSWGRGEILAQSSADVGALKHMIG